MNKTTTLLTIILALLFVSSPSMAQRKKVRKTKQKIEVPAENPKFTRMLASTAQVIVIDSMVTDSTDVLSAIPVNPEEGRVTTYSRFFNRPGDGFVYINELGNKCIYSQLDDEGRMRLYQSDLLGNSWTEGEELQGLDNERMIDMNYPYLMPDGITLYFAATGSESIGGYDIFRTRFDAEKGRYLKPENIGLPFNSESDDFMYIIDEQNQLAYFASNRRQTNGHACIYTFIPSETRKTLNIDDETKLRSMANLYRIADTWGKGTERNRALDRLESARNRQPSTKHKEAFSFIINDTKTYTSLSDFKVADNRDRMRELLAMQRQHTNIDTWLQKARKTYSQTAANSREKLAADILKNEKKMLELDKAIKQIKKDIRIAENKRK